MGREEEEGLTIRPPTAAHSPRRAQPKGSQGAAGERRDARMIDLIQYYYDRSNKTIVDRWW